MSKARNLGYGVVVLPLDMATYATITYSSGKVTKHKT